MTPRTAPASVRADLVTLTGVVRAVQGETFQLQTADGPITVEHDDFDYPSENRASIGDAVQVSGAFDDNSPAERTFEAEAVYIPRLVDNVMASAADEEGAEG